MPTVIATDISVRRLQQEDLPLLEQMYATFVPLREAFGLPPRDAAGRRSWLAKLQGGINLVAFADAKLAGHVVLMPNKHSAEMAVFVHQDFRRRAIGAALARAAVAEARAQGLRFLWVLISTDNSAARAGLLSFGFLTSWESLGEIQMVYRL